MTTNRWTAEVRRGEGRYGWVVLVDDAATGTHGRLWCENEATAESLAEQVNRPAPTAPADDLPPGVERISDGTLWLRREWRVPNGWAWECRLGEWSTAMGYARRLGMVQVRPVTPPEPEAEWVPWWEAFSDGLPLVEWGGQIIRNVQRQPSGVLLSTWGLFPVIRPNADGKVEVQK